MEYPGRYNLNNLNMKAQIKLPGEIEKICKKLSEGGFEAAIVGGSVRDLLSGGETHDWDLTTSATPEQILKIFKKEPMMKLKILP